MSEYFVDIMNIHKLEKSRILAGLILEEYFFIIQSFIYEFFYFYFNFAIYISFYIFGNYKRILSVKPKICRNLICCKNKNMINYSPGHTFLE